MKKIIIINLILFVIVGCGSSKSYLPKPSEMKHYLKGCIIDLSLKSNAETIVGDSIVVHHRSTSLMGEIIAVNGRMMNVLSITNGKLITVDKADIKFANIFISQRLNNPEKLNLFSTLSTVLVLGHGFWMVLTLPVNLLEKSSINGIYAMKLGRDVYWNELYRFSRFPQGIPSNITLSQIR